MIYPIEICPTANSTLAAWLYYLENRHAVEMQLGLTRIRTVAEKLGLLTPKVPVITVAGTNGKGSTVASLQTIYCAAGYQVGVYTSPHLVCFNERIQINQQPISDAALIQSFATIEAGRGNVHLTYFEMATLAALLYFHQHALDLIILEVGIGGRLDATNIIDADLAIITTIDFDHQAYLGNDLDSIGAEKAGILRSHKPLIYADTSPPTSILSQAAALNCPVFINNQQFSYAQELDVYKFYYGSTYFELPLPTIHGNAFAAALMAAQLLQTQLPLKTSALHYAAKTVNLAGRMQVIEKKRYTLVLDVSHNAQSVARLAEHVQTYYRDTVIHAVFSALCDKELSALIAPLTQNVTHWYPALLQGKRATSSNHLQQAFARHDIVAIFCHNSPLAAFQAACERAGEGDLIIVYGSFHTVGEIYPAVMAIE